MSRSNEYTPTAGDTVMLLLLMTCLLGHTTLSRYMISHDMVQDKIARVPGQQAPEILQVPADQCPPAAGESCCSAQPAAAMPYSLAAATA